MFWLAGYLTEYVHEGRLTVLYLVILYVHRFEKLLNKLDRKEALEPAWVLMIIGIFELK